MYQKLFINHERGVTYRLVNFAKPSLLVEVRVFCEHDIWHILINNS